MNCPNCGASNPDDSVFCAECGASLEGYAPEPGVPAVPATAPRPVGHPDRSLPKRCPSCGGPVYPDQARCLRCGAYYVAAAHAEARMVPQDASGPSLVASPGSWPELVAYLMVQLLVGILRLLSGIPRLLSGLLRQLLGQ